MDTRSRFLNETAVAQPAGMQMPKDWKSPLREAMFQIVVEETDGSPAHFIGPARGKELTDQLCEAVKLAIKVGKITGWANPHVVPVNKFAA